MATPRRSMASATTNHPPLNSSKLLRRAVLNRAFALTYACAIPALFYHHVKALLHPSTAANAIAALLLLPADAVLAFMWITAQSFLLYPIRNEEFPENLEKVVETGSFPALDVFICTADPYKEPPIGVVNTALSVMAYEYPTEKLSVYVSDDGGSELTLFAFMEAARFAGHWLPFCRERNLMERNPEAYFASNHCGGTEINKIKMMYESMKVRVEHAVERGKVGEEYIIGDRERQALGKWKDEFTRQNHAAVVEVLLDTSRDRDNAGNVMPNLVYLSREKSKNMPHHFKAGALNALLRVSAVMTNAAIILTLDCDMCSNDPEAPRRALCYLADPLTNQSQLGYVQFPQRFQGINEGDIYCGDFKYPYHINPPGMKNGPSYVGSGCFFRRRSLFGAPSAIVPLEIPELSPEHCPKGSIRTERTSVLAQKVAGCKYEHNTNWGHKVGFRYGSLVEDYYTGYKLQCEGWRSIFCHPKRAAFLGDAPICLIDVLNQNKRWAIGLLEVGFSKFSPVTYGVRSMGLLMGLSYAHYAFWPMWSVPITVYAFLPQIALINGLSIFPKVSEPWFLLYIFLFLGAYAQDLANFVLAGHNGTLRRWWNDQRMYLIRGVTSYASGTIEYTLKSLGVAAHGFSVTSKVLDDEQSRRYEQGVFEFGVVSPMFMVLAAAAIINLVSLVRGLMVAIVRRSGGCDAEGLVLQILLAGFGVVNGWPIYEAMFIRSDKGRIPTKVTLVSAFVASLLYTAASLA
ncbi:LOW QUALITY PROTEIN: cellulose synthase-like protein G3 [Eucalyptus grandis]|uniref:LOW QUALITY PROTEIN: cellulose synthase-like protein G3 n=1 Tax=Eucalyptus grandis TaxID=71139 RepID=UPI00192EB234|nr:LOW QUALITY PROTEIN: cellulose synthase-like protein G3 [Eucalyptus grandis]